MAVIAVGVDLVDIERLRAVLARRPRVADRLFRPAERQAVAGRADPLPGLAARFGAKEAVMKALGVGIGAARWRDVEVRTGPTGAPELVLHATAARLAAARGVTGWRCSLTHTSGLAAATVIALG
jgi:holo-[acyl-carrier protein] synthase